MAKEKKKKTKSCTLDQWEVIYGALDINSLRPWIEDKHLCPKKVKIVLDEFYLRMLANGNVYADFRAAFKVWFMKGWLSLTMEQARIIDAKDISRNVVHTKGISL